MGSTSVSRQGAPSKPTRRSGDPPAPALHPSPESPSHGQGTAGSIPDDGNGHSISATVPASPVRALSLDGHQEDAPVQRAALLSREELLRRRLRRVRQLACYYLLHYWGLMEAVRLRHRDYYWNFGRSPEEGGGGAGQEEEQKKGGVAAGLAAAAVEGSGRAGGGFGRAMVVGETGRGTRIGAPWRGAGRRRWL